MRSWFESANRAIRSFVGLSNAERSDVVRMAGLLFGLHVALSVLGFRRVLAWIERTGPRSAQATLSEADVDRRVTPIVRVLPWVPGARCLEAALAAKLVLARAGHPVNLRIGVARSATGEFVAHAWADDDRGIVIGRTFEGLPVSEYRTLRPLALLG
jgi:hypothetical protein